MVRRRKDMTFALPDFRSVCRVTSYDAGGSDPLRGLTNNARYAATDHCLQGTRIATLRTHIMCVSAAGCPHPQWNMPHRTTDDMNSDFRNALQANMVLMFEHRTLRPVSWSPCEDVAVVRSRS